MHRSLAAPCPDPLWHLKKKDGTLLSRKERICCRKECPSCPYRTTPRERISMICGTTIPTGRMPSWPPPWVVR